MGDEEAHRIAVNESHREDGQPASGRCEPDASHLHRMRGRGGGRYQGRDRYQRQRSQLRMEELLGLLVAIHGVTGAVRQQCVHIFWREMVDARIADRTIPESISNGVLKVSTKHSVWMQELRFFKAQMIEQINKWIDA